MGPGDDELHDEEGSNRLEGGAGNDFLTTGAGDDVLIGGSGRDNLDAGDGDDELRARDGERDVVDCGALAGDHATLDTRDADSGCAHVTGPRRLILHGLARAGARSARMVVSCSAQRTCLARVQRERRARAGEAANPGGRAQAHCPSGRARDRRRSG